MAKHQGKPHRLGDIHARSVLHEVNHTYKPHIYAYITSYQESCARLTLHEFPKSLA